MFKFLFSFFSFVYFFNSNSPAQETSVYLLPTLHGLHKTNPNYDYESLRRIVDSLAPDVIAVEMRQFDVGQDSVYLSANYPFEMRMMRNWFPGKQVVGFDWLGDDIEQKRIPPDYWKSVSPIKRYERELDADSFYSSKTSLCDSFSKRRLEILKTQSLKDILKSEDSRLVVAFYACLAKQLTGSIHSRVLAFYEMRNKKMSGNLQSLILSVPGKKIVVLTGDDHYAFLKQSIIHLPVFSD